MLKRVLLLFLPVLLFIAGCANGGIGKPGYVDVSAWSANYTEDYIQDFEIQTVDGQQTGVGGVQVKEFSKGGTGGRECCALMPGVGKTIKVVWRVGDGNAPKSLWKTYSQDVVVAGTMPTATREHSYLVVRFFPGHKAEAELFPSELLDPNNPRVDRLFSGSRVMRRMGE
ncbi:DUF3304 domain-containing protein [Pandoraea sp. NPDC090278]|uniref:DUF3304 domain-containing protein n=1 Tax=Pandoraea sp. NPDC090278 TaxID=3364391 RepID=UPI00383A8337